MINKTSQTIKHLAAMALAIATIPAIGIANADALNAKWETTDQFKNPESVLHDAGRNILYVSNVNGAPVDKDGNGFISTMSLDGQLENLEWIVGLNAPKGMAMHEGKLFVSDITALVEIDIDMGKVVNTYDIPEAKFLNDVAVDGDGNVYVSDMVDNKLYRLNGGEFTVWIDDEKLENPNGLYVEDDRLIVGSWGKMNPDFSTDVPGHLKSINLDNASISTLGNGMAVGNLDGVEADGSGNYLVSDWVAGALYQITPGGESEVLLDLNQGSADIEAIISENTVIIPMMNDNKVVAYTY